MSSFPAPFFSKSTTAPGFSHRKGIIAFTLVELLIVVALVAVIAILAIGQVKSMRDQANNVRCLGNLRQISVAVQTYLGENRNRFFRDATVPNRLEPTGMWVTSLRAILGQPAILNAQGTPEGGVFKLFICPADKTRGGWRSLGATAGIIGEENSPILGVRARSYLPNRLVLNRRLSEIVNPAKTILLADYPWGERGTLSIYPNDSGWYRHYPKDWHRGLMNCLFVDGHVESLEATQLVWGQSLAHLWHYDFPGPITYKTDLSNFP